MNKTKDHFPVSALFRTARTLSLAVSLSAALLFCGTVSAQYGGGGSGGTGSPASTGTAGSPGYGGYGSNGKAIGIGIGAAAGGAALLYLGLHHHGSLGGCVSESNDKLSFTDDKSGKTYSLLSNSSDLKPGERFQLSGKKSTDTQGTPTFEVKKVVKDLGSCH
jgi:hypothetical protein